MINNNKYDPTRTTSLRLQFSRDMDKRFNELVSFIKIVIVERDCFALKNIRTMQMVSVSDEEFDRESYAEEIALFLLWLQRQVDLGILTQSQYYHLGRIISQSWTNGYVKDAYYRGIMRAREEMIKAGMAVPSIDASGGIDVVASNLTHTQRLNMLYASVYNELQGATDAMRGRISQVLTQGLMQGKSPAAIYKEVRAVIDGTDMGVLGITDKIGRFIPTKARAEMIARTEIIRALHLAAVEEYRQWGVKGIVVMAEWRTAHDAKVCAKCASMEGQVFTLDEIEYKIPAHPGCRCFILPIMR